jgi:hypothetical protein
MVTKKLRGYDLSHNLLRIRASLAFLFVLLQYDAYTVPVEHLVGAPLERHNSQGLPDLCYFDILRMKLPTSPPRHNTDAMDRKVYLISSASTFSSTRISIALLLQDIDAMTD